MSGGTFADALDEACRRWPDRRAVTWNGAHATYLELQQRVAALARSYRALGIGRGDRIICHLPNRPEHLVALGAAWAVSAVHVGADHNLTDRELCWLVGHTQAAAVLHQPRTGGHLARRTVRALHGENAATSVVLVEEGAPQPWTDAGWLRFEDLVATDQPAPDGDNEPTRPAPDDAAMIMFTSGTTGTPKGSVADHGSFLQGWRLCADMLGFEPSDVHLVHLPLPHAFGLSMAVMALITGGRLVLEEGFSTDQALSRIATERVTTLSGSPAHYILLADALDHGNHDVSSLRIGVGSASAFTPELVRRIYARLGIELMVMYGSSEGVGVVTKDPEDLLRGSVGRPEPGEVRIVSADGAELPAGDVGEIAFNRMISPVRYWTDPRSRVAVEYDGSRPGDGGEWYYTGDLGRVDDEGRLFVMGRIKHIVDRGGLKVDPTEVTAALLECPGIADAAVVGTPNPVLGESICACVVTTDRQPPTLTDLRSRLAERLAPHKLPDELCLVDAIPRTALGKLDHDRLRAVAMADADRESVRGR